MVRWKYCLVLALLLLRTDAKDDDDDEEGEENDDEEEDEADETDDDEERPDTMDIPPGRRTRVLGTPPGQEGVTPSRTTKRAPLECYVCGYRSEMPLRSCLDPAKYRVHSVTCHNLDDKCFTTVISKDKAYVAVIRGCRTGCVGSPDTTCCERDRCNNQAFAMPIVPRAHSDSSEAAPLLSIAAKTTPSNVVFFVTVLLLLQTVVKVAFV
ncbi:glycosylphosphatidylinositol-anchored high density lipoprotein-binding protein 1-like isoform X2 [Cydia strobilella]|uniref:glycosylphosphatidylinositol-anchored high density lipoprotein-binding protein 1-like isoform X2 n=1 Tax=Cydia strobilella TaxID=1100964 RepID=UPI003006CBC3